MWLLDLFLAGVAWFLTLVDHAPLDEDGAYADPGESMTGVRRGPGARWPAEALPEHRSDAA